MAVTARKDDAATADQAATASASQLRQPPTPRWGGSKTQPPPPDLLPDRVGMLVELNQSLSRNRCPVEHVIVVDGNPGGTIPEELAGRAAVLPSPWPIGQAEARNLGLEAAKGGWVTSADDNDWLHSYSIDRLLEAISGQMTKTSWFYDLELLARRCALRLGTASHYFVQNTIDQGSSNNVASKNNDNTFVSFRKRTLLPSQCRFR